VLVLRLGLGLDLGLVSRLKLYMTNEPKFWTAPRHRPYKVAPMAVYTSSLSRLLLLNF